MKHSRAAGTFIASIVLGATGAWFAACSGSGGSTIAPTDQDATSVPPDGANDTSTSDADSNADARADADADGDADAADAADAFDANDGAEAAPPDCSQNPKLRDYSAGFFCAFSGGSCTNAETCCNPAKVGAVFPASFCGTGKDDDTTCAAEAAAHGSSYAAGASWECGDKNACGAGEICCLVPDPVQVANGKTLNIALFPATDPNHPPACAALRSYNEGGARCRAGATCDAGEIKLCSLSDDNCGAGTTCTPFLDARGVNRGFCK